MLELRPATVVAADGPRLEVEYDGGERAPAWADVALVGECEHGDQVIVNVQARRLELGSGGYDVVHCNLTRGMIGVGEDPGRNADPCSVATAVRAAAASGRATGRRAGA